MSISRKTDVPICPVCGDNKDVWVGNVNLEPFFDGWVSADCTCDECKRDFTAYFMCQEVWLEDNNDD